VQWEAFDWDLKQEWKDHVEAPHMEVAREANCKARSVTAQKSVLECLLKPFFRLKHF